MNETEINWTELTWNPNSGCEEVTAGCAFCYAKTLAENKRGTPAFPNGFDLTLRPHKLREPACVKRPSLIFTNSMSDLFWEKIPDDYRDRVLEAMRAAPHHRYQVLTKRPEIAARYLATRALPDCVWLGVTIESQKTAHRLDVLRDIPARVRFVSAEPLLSPLELDLRGVHWLISGGESGVHLAAGHTRALETRGLVRRGARGEPSWVAREDRIDWVRSLRDQCAAAGVAFWHKQWGGPRPTSAGRILDGRTWDELPRHVEGAMPGERYVHREERQASLAL